MDIVKTVARTMVSAGVEGHKVAKKLSKLAQLNISLQVEKDKQRSYYEEIGKLVHNENITNVTSSPMIKELREKIMMQDRVIEKLTDQINGIKKPSVCDYCGHVGKESEKYCSKCARPRK